ncbi:MAG: hypothetical protein Tsb009_23990 [Planctomycetaceae bacterium]
MIRKASLLFIGMLFLSTSSSAMAEEKGFVSLIQGNTLEGWIQHGGVAKYTVKDGVITGTAVPNTPNSFLCTKRHYADFILEVEFKVDPELNSGIQIRSHVFDKPTLVNFKTANGKQRQRKIPAGRVHGYQVEIDPSKRAWSGGIYDEGRRGWLYNLAGDKHAKARAAFKQGKWNHYRVEARGDRIKTWINGVPAADLKDGMTASGFIALQVHGVGRNPERAGKQVHWRNIRIRELKSR